MATRGVRNKATATRREGAPAGAQNQILKDDTIRLHRALTDLIRVYQFRDRDRICCYDVSVTQCYALEALVEHESLTLNGLAAHLYLDKSTASRVVDALEKKGYVERGEDVADRRSLKLEPTATGRSLVTRIRADILAQEEQLLANFSSEVRQSMAKLIAQLAAAAAQRVVASGGTACTSG